MQGILEMYQLLICVASQCSDVAHFNLQKVSNSHVVSPKELSLFVGKAPKCRPAECQSFNLVILS